MSTGVLCCRSYRLVVFEHMCVSDETTEKSDPLMSRLALCTRSQCAGGTEHRTAPVAEVYQVLFLSTLAYCLNKSSYVVGPSAVCNYTPHKK